MAPTKTTTANKTTTKKPASAKPAKATASRMSLAQAMDALKKAGSEQTRKTYARHGAEEPMFGTSFATLKVLTKKIDVDHELALALFDTGNFDARNLAYKIVDPARMTSAELDRWVREGSASRMCGGYAGMLAGEGPLAAKKLEAWLGSKDSKLRCAGWSLLGFFSQRDETTPDAFFEKKLAEIEKTIHTAPNGQRQDMIMAVVLIGCRNAALKKAALASAKKIGKVEIDHGDTACKTPDAAEYIEKTWAHSKSKGFESPAAHERTRETPRRRC
jgi:3-methyladenine DNA glycosylase AlkD